MLYFTFTSLKKVQKFTVVMLAVKKISWGRQFFLRFSRLFLRNKNFKKQL